MTKKNRSLRALLALLFTGLLGLATVACEDNDIGDELEDVGDEIEDAVD
jgi:TctA family transporter